MVEWVSAARDLVFRSTCSSSIDAAAALNGEEEASAGRKWLGERYERSYEEATRDTFHFG